MPSLPPELSGSADLGQNVGRLDDDQLVIADVIGRPAVLAVKHRVAHLDVDLHPLALLPPAGPDGEDFALRRLFLGGVRDVQRAAHGCRLLGGQDHHAVLEGIDLDLGVGLVAVAVDIGYASPIASDRLMVDDRGGPAAPVVRTTVAPSCRLLGGQDHHAVLEGIDLDLGFGLVAVAVDIGYASPIASDRLMVDDRGGPPAAPVVRTTVAPSWARRSCG